MDVHHRDTADQPSPRTVWRPAAGPKRSQPIAADVLFITIPEPLVLAAQDRRADDAFQNGLLAAVPNLRAFAISLARNPDRADDLVQETLVRGWSKRVQFQPGTNLNAWLFTILRNAFLSEYRRRKFEVADTDESYADSLTVAPPQEHRLHLQDLQAALSRLTTDQREALLLIAAEGFSYQEAAARTDCAVGTIKSRVNRARLRLTELMKAPNVAPRAS